MEQDHLRALEASGRLIVAATPLGCPADASQRLRDALGQAQLIAAEDTRKLRTLASLLHVRLTGELISLFEANEVSRVDMLITQMKAGKTVLLVSDAGMPLISDPGYRLVQASLHANIPISCLPGPSAVTTALVVSGLEVDRFCFEGFAPRRRGPRREWLASLVGQPRTIIFFESPRRLEQCLSDAVEICGATRPAVICRELTKPYEEIIRGSLLQLHQWASQEIRGEITVLFGKDSAVVDLDDARRQVEDLLRSGWTLKDACRDIARHSSGRISRSQLYNSVVTNQHDRDQPE